MITKKELNDFVRRAYGVACDKGFHDVELSNEHYLMLVLSEIGEMVEADRRNRHADRDGFERSTMCYARRFENYVKDTVDDELADVCIRLFDFCGARGVVLDDFPSDILSNFDSLFGEDSFCERCFALSSLVVECNNEESVGDGVPYVLCFCFCLAERLGIDLVWHIERKMEYNATRPKMHGKSY